MSKLVFLFVIQDVTQVTSGGRVSRITYEACRECPKGTYSTTGITTTCTECPLGYTTSGRGSNSSSQCDDTQYEI